MPNLACEETDAISYHASWCCSKFPKEDKESSLWLQGNMFCCWTDSSQRYLWINKCGGCVKTEPAEVYKAALLLWSMWWALKWCSKVVGDILQCSCWCFNVSHSGKIFHLGKCDREVWCAANFLNLTFENWLNNVRTLALHYTLRVILTWMAESFYRSWKTFQTCHQKICPCLSN